MTDEVSAFIELQSFDRWGEDFRSNYVTSGDARAASVNDVEVTQAYIQMENAWGHPLRLRIGRQDITLGKGWLVGETISPILDISYDGVRATWTEDTWNVDAIWAKLAENMAIEQDGDVDLYTLYGTYTGLEKMDVSLYWMFIRDALSLNDTTGGFALEAAEELLGLDQYGNTNLHTFGARFWGACQAWDYDLEVAYQTGDADAVGFRFANGVYGDDDAEFDSWAADLRLGYTFDTAWSPRVFFNAAYFDGEDNRDQGGFLHMLVGGPQASVSFNRMFSSVNYSAIFDIVPTAEAISNFYKYQLGVTAKPTDKIALGANVAYLGVVDEFDVPVLGFWTKEADDEIGVITQLSAGYTYSQDLSFKVLWEHLFAGEGLADGNYFSGNGLLFVGGRDDQDADYLQFYTSLKF